jgi:hypothetical protein
VVAAPLPGGSVHVAVGDLTVPKHSSSAGLVFAIVGAVIVLGGGGAGAWLYLRGGLARGPTVVRFDATPAAVVTAAPDGAVAGVIPTLEPEPATDGPAAVPKKALENREPKSRQSPEATQARGAKKDPEPKMESATRKPKADQKKLDRNSLLSPFH